MEEVCCFRRIGNSAHFHTREHIKTGFALTKLYVERNIEARSCNRSCSGQAIGVVCSLANLAWIAHARYCNLWPVRLCSILPHYLINGTIFENEKLLNIKCVFWLSLQLLSRKVLILRRTWARYDIKCILVLTLRRLMSYIYIWSTHSWCF